MANFENIAKKAFYMGVGFASYAQEKANDTLKELKVQAQKLADEMEQRGEMNAEEARRFVDELVAQAQQGTVPQSDRSADRQPRKIEIVDEDEVTNAKSSSSTQPDSNNSNNDNLRQQVQALQEELRRLKKEM